MTGRNIRFLKSSVTFEKSPMENARIEIRIATPEEYSAFCDFIFLVFGFDRKVTLEHLEKSISQGTGQLFLMWHGTFLLGSVMMNMQRDASGKPVVYLYSVGIHPRFQGRGIGKLMLQYVIEVGEEAIENAVFELSVREENTRAQGFYEKMGFVSYESLGMAQTDTRPGFRQYRRIGTI